MIFASRIQLLAFLLIAASTAFSLIYVWCCCAYDLAADEAHYWDWSRHLDWCYYSKGPLVAWLIRASCELFGSLSVAATGNLAAAVRLPAVLCHAAILTGSFLLAKGILRSPIAGLLVVLLEASLPLVRVGSVLMTIDPPFLGCWCWSLLSVWKAISAREGQNPNRWWLLAAVFTGLGVLAKFTMILLPVAVVSFLLAHRRAEFRRSGIWILLAGTLAAWIPILAWNASHDWTSFRHVMGQVGGERSLRPEFRWYGPLVFLSGQFGMLFGGWLLAFVAAGWRFRPQREEDEGLRLLWWCSVPAWCLFMAASFIKYGQPNWPAPAYIGGMILAVAWVREQLQSENARYIRRTLIGTLAASLLVLIGIHIPTLFRPILARFAGTPSSANPVPVRRLDLTARLSGWKTLAREVDRVRARLVLATGGEPVLGGTNWTLPGQLGFYCQGHPHVHTLGMPDGIDRHSQYDFWRPNPLSDAEDFLGRTFVIIGELGPRARGSFESVEPAIVVVHSENGVPLASWTIWVCHGFRGFPASSGHCTNY